MADEMAEINPERNRAGCIAISGELLMNLLNLSPCCRFNRFYVDRNWRVDQIHLLIEGPLLPEVDENHNAPYVTPVYTRDADGHVQFVEFAVKEDLSETPTSTPDVPCASKLNA